MFDIQKKLKKKLKSARFLKQGLHVEKRTLLVEQLTEQQGLIGQQIKAQ